MPQLIQNLIDNFNSLVSVKEIILLFLKFFPWRFPSPHGSTGECYQTFREDILSILHSLWENRINLMKLVLLWYNSETQWQKRKIQTKILYEYRYKNWKTISNKTQQYIKGESIITRNKNFVQYLKINQYNLPY